MAFFFIEFKTIRFVIIHAHFLIHFVQTVDQFNRNEYVFVRSNVIYFAPFDLLCATYIATAVQKGNEMQSPRDATIEVHNNKKKRVACKQKHTCTLGLWNAWSRICVYKTFASCDALQMWKSKRMNNGDNEYKQPKDKTNAQLNVIEEESKVPCNRVLAHIFHNLAHSEADTWHFYRAWFVFFPIFIRLRWIEGMPLLAIVVSVSANVFFLLIVCREWDSVAFALLFVCLLPTLYRTLPFVRSCSFFLAFSSLIFTFRSPFNVHSTHKQAQLWKWPSAWKRNAPNRNKFKWSTNKSYGVISYQSSTMRRERFARPQFFFRLLIAMQRQRPIL